MSTPEPAAAVRARTVEGRVNYIGNMTLRPRYYANDHSRDMLELDPRTVCDARSLEPADLVEADAVFDVAGVPEWSFEGWVVRYNPSHRWSYFSGMNRDEVLVFKTSDSDPNEPHCVPHSAFDDPSCPATVPPRASIEMRGTAYWFE